MEQRLETEDLHSESTDISSSIDADDLLHSGDSSLGEADKQIMEWAGKLELESIDLREKSEKLINTLTNMSQELMKVSSQLVKQLENCNHSKEEDIVDQVYKLDVNINNQLQDWKKSFSDQLKSINHNSNLGQIKNLTECMANQEANILGAIRHNSTILKDECRDIIKSQELAGAPKLQRAVDYLHEIMHNMSCQTESMNELLLSIDKQLHNIDLALIKEKDQYKVQFKAFKRSLRDMITSNRNNVEDTVVNTVQVIIERKLEDMFDKMFDQKLLGKLRLLITKGEIPVPEGSKLANAIPLNRHTNDYDLNGTTWTDSSSQDGPRTRARFRTKNKVTKPRKSEISRTIIPWCEISSPPVEYTSDL